MASNKRIWTPEQRAEQRATFLRNMEKGRAKKGAAAAELLPTPGVVFSSAPLPSPPTPGIGFDPNSFSSEIVPFRDSREMGSLHIDCLVAYLGQNPTRAVYLPGTVVEEYEQDPPAGLSPEQAVAWRSNNDHRKFRPAGQDSRTGTTYTFDRFDTRGRPIKERMTPDGHVWSRCQHIGHVIWFIDHRDKEKNREFRVQLKPEDHIRIERYRGMVAQASTRAAAEAAANGVEQGPTVLRAMGLAEGRE